VQLIVDHPNVLVGIVRAHFDFVRTATAGHFEEFVVLRPPLDELSIAIDDNENVVIAALPATLFSRLARRAESIVIAGGCERRREGAVGSPRLRTFGQRQLATLRDPNAVGRLGKHSSNGTPRPAFMLNAVGTVRKRLRPILDQFVRSKLFLPASLLRHSRSLCCEGRQGLQWDAAG
jgi:hypothetical protein